MIVRVSALALLAGAALSAAPAGSVPTYSKDVAPILHSRCVECHRRGEPAPMALTSYQEARPWAKAIKQAVLQHVMPPWLADPQHGAFKNARGVPQHDFAIPPGDGNYPVKSTWTAKQDVTLLGLMPHMHLRGKDFQYTVVYPDGREEVILNVPRYDFNWQLEYQIQQPLELPKGTRIDCIAHFDNSANNKYNPDPTKEVKWGDQTWEEMMIGWFTYRVPNVPGAAPPAPTVGNE
jgi:hypothetical protein